MSIASALCELRQKIASFTGNGCQLFRVSSLLESQPRPNAGAECLLDVELGIRLGVRSYIIRVNYASI